MIDPAQALLDATKAYVGEVVSERMAAKLTAEAMRPYWAQGHTSDSVAAQTAISALSELWGLLHAQDQTQAVASLRRLLLAAEPSKRPAASRFGLPDEQA